MVIPWDGFPLSKLIKKAQPTSKAKYVKFTTFMDEKRPLALSGTTTMIGHTPRPSFRRGK